jgi:hypothetical protein
MPATRHADSPSRNMKFFNGVCVFGSKKGARCKKKMDKVVPGDNGWSSPLAAAYASLFWAPPLPFQTRRLQSCSGALGCRVARPVKKGPEKSKCYISAPKRTKSAQSSCGLGLGEWAESGIAENPARKLRNWIFSERDSGGIHTFACSVEISCSAFCSLNL